MLSPARSAARRQSWQVELETQAGAKGFGLGFAAGLMPSKWVCRDGRKWATTLAKAAWTSLTVMNGRSQPINAPPVGQDADWRCVLALGFGLAQKAQRREQASGVISRAAEGEHGANNRGNEHG